MQREHRSPGQIRFSRGLRPRQVTTLGLGVIVILIVFVLLGDAVAIAGSFAPLALLLAALVLLLNILSYIELAMSVPRAGGAYVQVHEAQGRTLAFLTGWVLTLCCLGVCALLAQGFAVQVTTLLHDHLGMTLHGWPWAVGLVILSAANNILGTRESRHELLIVILMVVLVGFALLAAPHVKSYHYLAVRRNWEQALTLLLVSFVGLEVSANLQGEMGHRASHTPRMLLSTPILAVAIAAVITAVAVGVAGPESLAGSRIPLALLGASVAGAAGRPFILVIGALALALALDRMLMLAVRQIYLMSADGFFPAILRRVHLRFRTPALLIALTALLVLPLALLSVNFLGQLISLLYLLVLMAVNLTLFRRQQSASSSFALPFHPWVPGLTLAADVLIGLLWGAVYLAWAAGWLGAGILLYLTYARSHHIESQEGVTVFKPPGEEPEKVGYRVLVPIANPATAGTLLHLAGVLARQQGGEVLALQVLVIPDQVPLEVGQFRAQASRVLLERAINQAQEEDFAIRTMTRVAHSVTQGVLDTAREENVDLILMGWRGYTRSFGASMGPIIDAVIRDAPCDVTVAKGDEWSQARRILVPTAGGPHAPIAARLAMLLSEAYDSDVTVLYVQLGRATPEQMEANRDRLARTLNGLNFSRPPRQKVIIADSVVEGIVREAEGYDLVLLGASEEGLFDQFVFGNIPQQIAARVPKTAVIVRRYGGPTEFWTRKVIRGLFGLLPRLNVEEQLELREAMSDSASPGVNYFVLIVLSCIIATLGLLLDSAAVVIGAMLVAPLMSPILGFSLGMVLGDVRLIRLSIEAVFKGVALAIIIAVFIGVLSPFRELTGEIMARTQPNLFDLTVALASGMAGAYALARKDVSAALPGVAVSAALMPPLGVAGLGLSLGEPQVAGGAFLLFATNIASISLAGAIVFVLLGVRPETWQPETREQVRRGLMGFTFLLLLIAIPLGIIMRGAIQDTAQEQMIRETLTQRLTTEDDRLVSLEIDRRDVGLTIVATVHSTSALDPDLVDETVEVLSEQLELPVQLEVVVLPTIRSAPSLDTGNHTQTKEE
jgi:uncharacterized hydrophobic protein (TIGR00271 family)